MEKRADEEVVEADRSWKERHGATVIAVVVVLILVLTVALQMTL